MEEDISLAEQTIESWSFKCYLFPKSNNTKINDAATKGRCGKN